MCLWFLCAKGGRVFVFRSSAFRRFVAVSIPQSVSRSIKNFTRDCFMFGEAGEVRRRGLAVLSCVIQRTDWPAPWSKRWAVSGSMSGRGCFEKTGFQCRVCTLTEVRRPAWQAMFAFSIFARLDTNIGYFNTGGPFHSLLSLRSFSFKGPFQEVLSGFYRKRMLVQYPLTS